MKRGTTFDKTNALLRDFREKVPGMAIRTSLIVGYPGETEEDFVILKNWVRDTKFDRLGVFTYSHEENTSAHDLVDDVPAEVKSARAEEIMAIQQEISMQLNGAKVGKEYKVLIDRKEGNFFIGRTEFDSPDVDNEVLIDATNHFVRQGDFVKVKVFEASDYDLYAEPVV
jgi:ribosomal protein S12 methylthiotransferase